MTRALDKRITDGVMIKSVISKEKDGQPARRRASSRAIAAPGDGQPSANSKRRSYLYRPASRAPGLNARPASGCYRSALRRAGSAKAREHALHLGHPQTQEKKSHRKAAENAKTTT